MKRFAIVLSLAALTFATQTRAEAAVRNLFFAGTCSQNWSDAARNSGYETVDEFGFWAGEETWDLYVDQTASLSTAVATLKSSLDQLCTGGNSCYVFTYSQGGGIVSKLFSDYSTAWNIVWVAVAANNEGGSELSSADWLAELVLGCSYASRVRPGDNRITGWNHNDTNGKTIKNFGGDIGAGHALWWVTSGLLPGDDDGVVAFHSAGAFTAVVSSTDLCAGTKWSNHSIMATCAGYNLDHLEMKRKAICYYGGGGTCP